MCVKNAFLGLASLPPGQRWWCCLSVQWGWGKKMSYKASLLDQEDEFLTQKTTWAPLSCWAVLEICLNSKISYVKSEFRILGQFFELCILRFSLNFALPIGPYSSLLCIIFFKQRSLKIQLIPFYSWNILLTNCACLLMLNQNVDRSWHLLLSLII